MLRRRTHTIDVIDPLVAAARRGGRWRAGDGADPGRVASVLVKPGDAVVRSQVLVVLEAMKMELTLTAPDDGVVSAVHCAARRYGGRGHRAGSLPGAGLKFAGPGGAAPGAGGGAEPRAGKGAAVKHAPVTLEDKYQPDIDRVYLTGTQALVRLPLLQRQRDLAAGLQHRRLHLRLSRLAARPDRHPDVGGARAPRRQPHRLPPRRERGTRRHRHLGQPAAAAAARRATTTACSPIWYGKGPGVDRSGDVFKHANYAGTVAAPAACCWWPATTTPANPRPCRTRASRPSSPPPVPVLVPADVRDLLELGLHGWAMSRWSGRYVGFKTVADVVDSSASVAFDLAGFATRDPDGPHPDAHIRLPDPPLEQEARVFAIGLPAAQAYARANRLDRIVLDPPGARFGIVTVGKSYHDTRQALAELGLGDGARAGIRLLKLALAWPVDPEIVAALRRRARRRSSSSRKRRR